MNRIALSFFLLSLLMPCATAVGFSNLPGNREVLFTPGGHVEVPVIVTNAARIRATIVPDPGDPATLGTPEDNNIGEYVRLVDPDPDMAPREVRIIFDFPAQLRPGTYNVDVYSTELKDLGGAAVAGQASAKFRLTVRVLSPEKQLDILALFAPPMAEGLPANATVVVVSRTTQVIDTVDAVFTIGIDGTTLEQGGASMSGLASAQTMPISAIIPAERLPGGEYDLTVNVTYDGKHVSAGPVILKIGTLHVGIPEYTRELTYNVTNKFLFNVSNEWNRELKDVYALVDVQGHPQKKTASLNIPPFGKREFEIYFDREPVFPIGELPVNVTITFRDYDPVSEEYVAKVERFPLTPVIVAPQVQERSGAGALYAVIGVALAVVLLVLFLVLRRKKEPPQVQHAP